MVSRLFFPSLRHAPPRSLPVSPRLFLPLALLSLPLTLLALGCNTPDPTWALPCDQRPERTVTPGTGEGEFHVIDDNPLPIQYGDQGGQHIWVGVRLEGFGEHPTIEFGIRDAADSTLSYSGPNAEHLELHYNSDAEASEASGLFGYLYGYDESTGEELPSPSGKTVILWADVVDTCGVTVHGETQASVQ